MRAFVLIVAAIAAAACGGGSPTAPSAAVSLPSFSIPAPSSTSDLPPGRYWMLMFPGDIMVVDGTLTRTCTRPADMDRMPLIGAELDVERVPGGWRASRFESSTRFELRIVDGGSVENPQPASGNAQGETSDRTPSGPFATGGSMAIDEPRGATLQVERTSFGSFSGTLRGTMRFLDASGRVAPCTATTFSLSRQSTVGG